MLTISHMSKPIQVFIEPNISSKFEGYCQKMEAPSRQQAYIISFQLSPL